MVDLTKLNEVRRLLNEATEFSSVWDYFLTNFGERDDFMQMGDPIQDDELIQKVVGEVCKSLFPGLQMIMIRGRLIRIPEYQFVHGSLILDNRMSGIIYFEDIHKGMMSVVWSLSPPETKFVRFTGRALYEGLGRSTN